MPEEIRAISQAYYDQRQTKAEAVEKPVLVLVGGQTGAGKSGAARIARDELRRTGGFIHVDADRLRERINLRGATPTSEETQATAGALASALRQVAMHGRRNLLEEGTFRNPATLEGFVKRIQGAAYRVELVAVATPFEESRLGIYQRFEAQYAQGNPNPRFISDRYHDESALGFADTVAKLAGQFDRVRVINRAGDLHFDSQVPGPHRSAIDALRAGQTIGPERLGQVVDGWNLVHALAAGRNAPGDYLEAIERHRQLAVADRAARAPSPAADEIAARRAFELALDAKQVPEAMRPQLREHFATELAQRGSQGQRLAVPVYDAASGKALRPSVGADPTTTTPQIEPRGPKR